MPITEWREPIYLLQKGENKRSHHYFKRKKDENLSQSQLTQKLKEEYHNIMREPWGDCEGLCNELKKYFADYDVQKFIKCYDFEKQQPKEYNPDYTPIAESQIAEWSRKDNWEERIFQETRDIQEANSKMKLRIRADNVMEIFKLEEEARLLNLKDLVLGLKSGALNGTQRQAITKSNKDLQDATNRDLGEVKDINQSNVTAEVNADVNSEITVNLLNKVKKKRSELNDLNSN